MKPKRRITKFNFEGDNAAVSLVSKDVGGAANQYTTLLTKSTDVVVELSMAEYLSRFFDLWSYDAMIISKLLGYSDDYELWDEGKLEEKTTILSKMREAKEYSQEDLESVAPLMKSLAKASNYQISDLNEILKNADGEEPVSETLEEDVTKSSNTSPKEEVTMTTENVEMIEKSAMDAAIEKAKQEAKDAAKAEFEAIEKGLKDQLEEFNKAKEAAEKETFLAKAKEFEVAGVKEEAEVDAMAVALQKASKDAELEILVKSLETLTMLTKNLEGEKEQGHGVNLEATGTSVSDILKAKQAKKSK